MSKGSLIIKKCERCNSLFSKNDMIDMYKTRYSENVDNPKICPYCLLKEKGEVG